MGVFGYADDLSLLCLSFSGMREMLKICESCVNENNFLFNVSKRQILNFGKNEVSGNAMKPILCIYNGQLNLCRKMYTLRYYFKFHFQVTDNDN